jgi:hypothetical protein
VTSLSTSYVLRFRGSCWECCGGGAVNRWQGGRVSDSHPTRPRTCGRRRFHVMEGTLGADGAVRVMTRSVAPAPSNAPSSSRCMCSRAAGELSRIRVPALAGCISYPSNTQADARPQRPQQQRARRPVLSRATFGHQPLPCVRGAGVRAPLSRRLCSPALDSALGTACGASAGRSSAGTATPCCVAAILLYGHNACSRVSARAQRKRAATRAALDAVLWGRGPAAAISSSRGAARLLLHKQPPTSRYCRYHRCLSRGSKEIFGRPHLDSELEDQAARCYHSDHSKLFVAMEFSDAIH